jgi:hypothetical protein
MESIFIKLWQKLQKRKFKFQKHFLSDCHAGLDPASSVQNFEKNRGFQVSPE